MSLTKGILATICILSMGILVGCTETTSPAVDSGTESGLTPTKGGATIQTIAKVTKKHISGWTNCKFPKYNCFDPVIVTPSKLGQLGDLDDAIANSTQSSFFSISTNYDDIWTSIPSTILTDLQLGTTVLTKTPDSDTISVEYACMDGSGNAVDYSTVP